MDRLPAPDREPAGWYVNLQDPFRRTPIGIDPLDHELDLWWPAGAPRDVWKDVEPFGHRLAEGRYPGMADATRAEGDRLAALLEVVVDRPDRRRDALDELRRMPDEGLFDDDALDEAPRPSHVL